MLKTVIPATASTVIILAMLLSSCADDDSRDTSTGYMEPVRSFDQGKYTYSDSVETPPGAGLTSGSIEYNTTTVDLDLDDSRGFITVIGDYVCILADSDPTATGSDQIRLCFDSGGTIPESYKGTALLGTDHEEIAIDITITENDNFYDVLGDGNDFSVPRVPY